MNGKSRLEKLIALGQRAYILRYGVVRFGLTTAVAVIVSEWLIGRRLTLPQVIAPLIICPLVGVAVGGMMWSLLRGRYELARLDERR